MTQTLFFIIFHYFTSKRKKNGRNSIKNVLCVFSMFFLKHVQISSSHAFSGARNRTFSVFSFQRAARKPEKTSKNGVFGVFLHCATSNIFQSHLITASTSPTNSNLVFFSNLRATFSAARQNEKKNGGICNIFVPCVPPCPHLSHISVSSHNSQY